MEGGVCDCGFEICGEKQEGGGGRNVSGAVMMDGRVARRHLATKAVTGSLDGVLRVKSV